MPSTRDDDPRIGLKLGFQRRFLNHGFMDFAVALQQGTPFFHYGVFDNRDLSTQASFGFAFGTGKRRRSGRSAMCFYVMNICPVNGKSVFRNSPWGDT